MLDPSGSQASHGSAFTGGVWKGSGAVGDTTWAYCDSGSEWLPTTVQVVVFYCPFFEQACARCQLSTVVGIGELGI